MILNKREVIHAIEDGINIIHLFDFCRTDRICVLRPIGLINSQLFLITLRAQLEIGKPYDFIFDFNNDAAFSCTEFVAYCLKEFITIEKEEVKLFGFIKKKIIKPTTFLLSPHLEKVY